MHITHIVLNRLGQGTYWRSFFFSKWLVKKGHQVTIVVTSPRNQASLKETWQDGVRIVQSPDLFRGALRSGWDPWNTFRRIHWLHDKPVDLVHAFESRPTVIYPALYLYKIRKTPLVMDWADWFGKGGSVEQRPNPVVRTILRPVETYFEEHFRTQAEATTVICSELRDRALRIGITQNSIRLIYNGCNTDQNPSIEVEDAREQVKLTPGGLYIGYVGSIFRADAQLMAKAFDRVVEQRSGVHLVIAGYFPLDFRELTRFPEAVLQMGYLDSDQLHAVLSCCDLFWLPMQNSTANRGRFPLKLNDYLTAGRPCIATEVGDIPLLFASEQVGMVCQPSPESLAEKTLMLLENKSLRQRLGMHAREVAEGAWNWSQKTEELEALYQEVIEKKR